MLHCRLATPATSVGLLSWNVIEFDDGLLVVGVGVGVVAPPFDTDLPYLSTVEIIFTFCGGVLLAATLPALSTVLHVTVVVPNLKIEPEAGWQPEVI
jgi:hypothetical protein